MRLRDWYFLSSCLTSTWKRIRRWLCDLIRRQIKNKNIQWDNDLEIYLYRIREAPRNTKFHRDSRIILTDDPRDKCTHLRNNLALLLSLGDELFHMQATNYESESSAGRPACRDIVHSSLTRVIARVSRIHVLRKSVQGSMCTRAN